MTCGVTARAAECSSFQAIIASIFEFASYVVACSIAVTWCERYTALLTRIATSCSSFATTHASIAAIDGLASSNKVAQRQLVCQEALRSCTPHLKQSRRQSPAWQCRTDAPSFVLPPHAPPVVSVHTESDAIKASISSLAVSYRCHIIRFTATCLITCFSAHLV